jgi:hypothetical protein
VYIQTGGGLPEGQTVVGSGVGDEVSPVGAEGAGGDGARVRGQRLATARAELVQRQLPRVAAHCTQHTTHIASKYSQQHVRLYKTVKLHQ